MGTPDFNVDKGLWMPDQDADQAPTECTGYMATDLCADMDGILYSPDRQYAYTLFLEGIGPTEEGADPLAALESTILFGLVAQNGAPLSAKMNGELLCANYKNWSNTPGINPKVRVYNALGNGAPFNSVISAAFLSKLGVGLCSLWYPEWEGVGSDGILQMPDLTNTNAPGHAYAMKGQKTINGVMYWVLKSWQGSKYGDNGWVYMNGSIANAVFAMGTNSANALSPTGSRWISLVQIALRHLNAIPVILPELATAH